MGGIIRARISAIQILYGIFVRNLFGVFKDLCGYMLGFAFAHPTMPYLLVNDN